MRHCSFHVRIDARRGTAVVPSARSHTLAETAEKLQAAHSTVRTRLSSAAALKCAMALCPALDRETGLIDRAGDHDRCLYTYENVAPARSALKVIADMGGKALVWSTTTSDPNETFGRLAWRAKLEYPEVSRSAE